MTEKILEESMSAEAINNGAADEQVILPFSYAEDEHYYIESVEPLKKKPLYSFVKRAFDIVCSFFGLLFLGIPMLFVALAIKLTSKGPVFYSQERLGLNGKKFMLVKFRTMRQDAEKAGAQWSQGDSDKRITKVGAILRKTRIDELPQLWLCLTGTLSLIGPRPEREIFYKEFEKHVHGFSERLKVKPGLTGWAQVNGGYDLRPEEKVVYDVEYIKNRSILMEIKILFKTVAVILNHDGAK
ncbi:MAG: sugar transferase [Clostridia bacterium]|nr:sugar transferase [Clostridia bacterium]